MRFCWPWRPYQARALAAASRHLSDGKLHVVAAPGAGKTSLGLEVFRQVGKPALVLAPTRAIRNQWVLRLQDFLSADTPFPPAWTSTRLEAPAWFTSVTYQALHSHYRDVDDDDGTEQGEADSAPSNDEMSRLVTRLQGAGIGMLILDEAHHLRAEWWKALSTIVARMPELVLVSLTATPPYDVTGQEWSKYQSLCGPIDEEISIPELVKAGTLCPHQDYVWMVTPSDQDRDALVAYDAAVEQTCTELLGDAVFRHAVTNHPWVSSPEPDIAEILDHPETAVSLIVYLVALQADLPQKLLRLLDVRAASLPQIDRRWWQTLVQAYLYSPRWPRPEDVQRHRDDLARRLRQRGLLFRRQVQLEASDRMQRRLTECATKIGACVDIYRHEHTFRGSSLRLVILTDYIRDETYGAEPSTGHSRLGAWTVFRELTRHTAPDEACHLALLSGRLTLLHESKLDEFLALPGAAETGVSMCPGLPGFRRLTGASGCLTAQFTVLLQRGAIRALVGTRALLGEGWDAPVLNAIVLCSQVRSFMLTNQMRGRAIRTDRQQPNKAASLWHLAAVVPETAAGLSDLDHLRRRFSTFVGVGAETPVIENGLDRLNVTWLENGGIVPRHIAAMANNSAMVQRLQDSASLENQWQAALLQGTEGKVIPGIKTDGTREPKAYAFYNTLRYLLREIAFSFFGSIAHVLQSARGLHHGGLRVLLWVLLLGCIVGCIGTFPLLLRAALILLRHLPVDGAIRQMALALRDTLHATGFLTGTTSDRCVRTDRREDGSCTIFLEGADTYEQALFADCMREILDPVQNPRYLITRQGPFWGFKRADYHAVPTVLGQKKERAEAFHRAWRRRVGPARLIYTRTGETRKILLKARTGAFAATMAPASRRLDRWH